MDHRQSYVIYPDYSTKSAICSRLAIFSLIKPTYQMEMEYLVLCTAEGSINICAL